jgi:hypothetical protein
MNIIKFLPYEIQPNNMKIQFLSHKEHSGFRHQSNFNCQYNGRGASILVTENTFLLSAEVACYQTPIVCTTAMKHQVLG